MPSCWRPELVSWDPDAIIETLVATAPAGLAELDGAGLRHFVELVLLAQHERRPMTFAEFARERPDRPRPAPFVYDRPSRLVFLGGWATHSRIAAQLYHFRQIALDPRPDWQELRWACIDCDVYFDLAVRFIDSGMGFLACSPSAQMGRYTLNLGRGIALTREERQVFADYRLEHI